MRVRDICNILNELAPVNTCLDFDNVGLLVGDYDQDVKKILLALDLTTNVLEEAIDEKADFILTHHPLIFSPLKKINNDSIVGNSVMKLIKNNISYYASHTNLDKAECGTNMYLANILGLNDISFVDDENLICVTGNVDTNLKLLVDKIKKELSIDYLRLVGENDDININKVAVATGAGDSYGLFSACKSLGVDVLITGDLKYHTMQFAKDIGLTVIDATHFYTENIVMENMQKILAKKLENVEIVISKKEENIFKTI